ncbi:MAG: GNAT family N-acetyltransferase [Cytophagales bacterium]|nr:MAG: GNAT family N-acetyltransferase [Cytophagales bacterium]TAF61363.1 MAG: GNAT family N-acetyltransferase [Cytophagales bacterium]
MTQSVEIRPYQAQDKASVLELLRLNTPQFFAPEEEADLSFYLDQETELYYVLLYEAKIVGCGGINFDESQTHGKLSWDILHPLYQGRYLGQMLLEYRTEKLKSMPSVQKITVRTSQMAFMFYQKQGFVLLEVIKNYWAMGFDMYHMEYQNL